MTFSKRKKEEAFAPSSTRQYIGIKFPLGWATVNQTHHPLDKSLKLLKAIKNHYKVH